MEFNTTMIVTKKGAGLALIKFVVYSVIFILISGGITGTFVLIGLFISKLIGFENILMLILGILMLILGIVWLISTVIAINVVNYMRGCRKTVTYIDNAGNISSIYKGNNYTFNLLSEYNNRNLVLTHFTYSETIGIELYNSFGYKVYIKGNSDLLRYLLPIAGMYGIRVPQVDDEPSDLD